MNWDSYYTNTKLLPPSPIVVEAVGLVSKKQKALDLGSGALKNTKYLLGEGFEVTAVDKDESSLQFGKDLASEKFHHQIISFEEYDFSVAEYDLICATFSLPFAHPNSFDSVFDGMKKSLKTGGIFCGQLFGVHDSWASTRGEMTFHTKEQVGDLFQDMELISLQEEDEDGATANGTPKHWHVFHIIARK